MSLPDFSELDDPQDWKTYEEWQEEDRHVLLGEHGTWMMRKGVKVCLFYIDQTREDRA